MLLFKPSKHYEFAAPVGDNLSFSSSEAFNLIRTNMRFSLPEKETANIIAITSPIPTEGKSYCAVNIACALSRADAQTLIIDCDLRKPTIIKKLGLEKTKKGLTELIIGEEYTFNAIYESGLNEKLFVIDSGAIPPNPSELLSSKEMRNILSRLSERYKYIILDLPPVEAVSDAVTLADVVDGAVIVVRDGLSQKRIIKNAINQIRFSGMKILGFVYNGYGYESKYHYKSYKYYQKYYHNYY